MTGPETKFNAFIAAIADPALRVRVEDSAMVNSWGDPELVGADNARFWQVALSTAEECVSCARDYYPELYGAAR
jgi:hypothetical protein